MVLLIPLNPLRALQLSQCRLCPIGRSIIDHNDLNIFHRLRTNAFDCLADKWRTVKNWDDYCYECHEALCTALLMLISPLLTICPFLCTRSTDIDGNAFGNNVERT